MLSKLVPLSINCLEIASYKNDFVVRKHLACLSTIKKITRKSPKNHIQLQIIKEKKKHKTELIQKNEKIF